MADLTGAFAVDISPREAGWTYSGLRVVTLDAGVPQEISTGDSETLVLPLAGSAVVECEDARIELHGRGGGGGGAAGRGGGGF
jgi:5-deoxy-glucuronate isomerase